MLDAAVASRDGRFFFLGRPAFLASLLAWSIPFWLAFELANLRLANWFYVEVPADRAARWAGIGLSFATVLPAIYGAERLLRAWGVADRLAGPALPAIVAPRSLRIVQAAGVALTLLPLALPRLLFPLVWVGPTLVVDPWVHRRASERSLLGDVARGRYGRIARLLAGGLAIGVVWELLNAVTRTRWIYTVPGFEELKLFEMPLLGFLGFPVFALEGYAVYAALVAAGLAVDEAGRIRPAPRLRRAAAALAAIALSAVAVRGMERSTIVSTTSRLADLPIPGGRLEAAGYDVAGLAGASPEAVAADLGVPPARAMSWIAIAGVADLRGIGSRNAMRLYGAGIASVEDLAAADPARIAVLGRPFTPARARVWIRAAARSVDGEPPPKGIGTD